MDILFSWKENVHISILNFFFKRFGQYIKKKVKKWIFQCIFKKWFDRCRVKFLTKKNSEKAEHPQICLSLGVSMPKSQIKQCPLTPSPTKLSWHRGGWGRAWRFFGWGDGLTLRQIHKRQGQNVVQHTFPATSSLLASNFR